MAASFPHTATLAYPVPPAVNCDPSLKAKPSATLTVYLLACFAIRLILPDACLHAFCKECTARPRAHLYLDACARTCLIQISCTFVPRVVHTHMHERIDTVLWVFRAYKYTKRTLGGWIDAAWLTRAWPTNAVVLHNGEEHDCQEHYERGRNKKLHFSAELRPLHKHFTKVSVRKRLPHVFNMINSRSCGRAAVT